MKIEIEISKEIFAKLCTVLEQEGYRVISNTLYEDKEEFILTASQKPSIIIYTKDITVMNYLPYPF